jgi:uncharacterized protein with PQ loop repeat
MNEVVALEHPAYRFGNKAIFRWNKPLQLGIINYWLAKPKMSRYHNHHRLKKRTLVVKKTKNVKMADRATFVVAVLEPIITVPQVITIFSDKTAAGVSLATWVGYEMLTLVWLWYAIIHKDKLIFLYQGLFFIIQTGVIIGGLMYGAKW